ncbi:MAG: hypothetical protein IPQ04_14360 [Saprospiraceae bacterium]|nr:hypothetical protein [Saprospiraceae bacterium]
MQINPSREIGNMPAIMHEKSSLCLVSRQRTQVRIAMIWILVANDIFTIVVAQSFGSTISCTECGRCTSNLSCQSYGKLLI